ncbi:PREDICTED: toll-like receptor 3 [Papilio xuthus]|uniref:Toll-like receptor 3 n=1 Tax=Papilio xuthus TaxID=66420 RepID=A0AAJ7E6S3_PAPXU|nr:PREDICTED: toll-like receptor 3 [Papilio xuthus]
MHLNLSFNMLSQFPLGLFDQKTKLTTLDLTGNKIVSFELGIFDPLRRLKSLYLSSNSFVGKDLNPYLFDQNPNLSILDFSRNDMSQSPDNLLHALYNLETLNLDRTLLNVVPKFATSSNLKSLKHLILSTNQIKRIDDPTVFINLDSLKVLDLSKNNLDFIHENTFKTLRNLVGIILRSNQITTLPETLFQNVPKLINIELSDNQLETITVDSFKGTSLKNLNLSDNKIKFLPKNFCLELQNIDVTLAKLYFLPNPWECACMNELVNEIKNMNILYDGDDFDGEHQVCVVRDKFICDRTLKMLNIFLILIFTFLIVDCKLSCKSDNGQKDLGCSAGESDYVLKRGVVSDNNITTGITLKACRISDIEKESFNGLPALEYLDLAENKIKNLKLGVLDGAKQVMYLNLSYNLLSEFELGLFDQKPNLKLLDLRGNTIFHLKLGIFDALKNIQHIDLSSNSFLGKDINPYTFDRSKEIKFIDFSRNDMSESPDNLLHAFRGLDFLNLDRCFLKEVPRFATIPNLKNLKHLMLSTNLISKIDNGAIFVNLDNLEILNLAENCLEYINEKSLKPLRNLKMIVLRDNKFKKISNDLFRNLPVLGIVDLSSNELSTIPVAQDRSSGDLRGRPSPEGVL